MITGLVQIRALSRRDNSSAMLISRGLPVLAAACRDAILGRLGVSVEPV